MISATPYAACARDPVSRASPRVMHQLARDVPIEVLSPLSSLVESERLQPLFEARLIPTFSLLALLPAAVGTSSTLAYSIAQRRHELAIRIALGAEPSNVARLVVRHGAFLALGGVMVGVAGSLVVARTPQSTLYDTSATDPRVFVASATLLVVVAVLACVVPPRRAARVDPVVALREPD
jgi:putative ABC transport system permease protein